MIKTLIVDDETSCREALKNLIKRYTTEVEIIGSTNSIDSAYDIINEKNPDLVFLDVSMPPTDGFELLKKFKTFPAEVIFTTAFNQYALQAIKVSAIDYLMKPIDSDELVAAIDKVKKKLQLSQGGKGFEKIMVPADRSIMFIAPKDIIRIEANDKKLVFILKGGKTMDVYKNLTEYENTLAGYGFFRAHRAHLINVAEIKEYIPDRNGGFAIMNDNKHIPIASRRREEFMSIFRSTP
jgi:two-component system LytT family response regulator